MTRSHKNVSICIRNHACRCGSCRTHRTPGPLVAPLTHFPERPKVGNNATGMDTLQVVSGLEAYFVTLQAEVDEIGRDMQNCQVLNNKYGRFWSPGLNSLQQLKAVKEQQV